MNTKSVLTWLGAIIVVGVIAGLIWTAFFLKHKEIPVVPPYNEDNTSVSYPACVPDQIAYKGAVKQCRCDGLLEYWDDNNTYCRDTKM